MENLFLGTPHFPYREYRVHIHDPLLLGFSPGHFATIARNIVEWQNCTGWK